MADQGNGQSPTGPIDAAQLFRQSAQQLQEQHRDWPAEVLLGKRTDPAAGTTLPPNMGGPVVPHILTFAGRASTTSQVYRNPDEAVRDSPDNARYMRNHPLVMESLEGRQRGTALAKWHLEADDPDSLAQQDLVDKLTKMLEAIPRFTEYRVNCLHALWYGRYGIAHEFGWKTIKGYDRIVPVHWKPINGDKLAFRYDDGTGEHWDQQVGIRVGAGFKLGDHLLGGRWRIEEEALTMAGRLRKVQATDRGLAYFLDPWERPLLLIHKHMIEDGDYFDPWAAGSIHGIGIRSRIYFTWLQMTECLAWLMEYLERSAFGLQIWKYPTGNAQAEAATRKAAEEQVGGGRNIILFPIPLGEEAPLFDIQHIEPSMAGAEAMRSIIEHYFGWQIKRYVLGQVLTSEAEATGLGSGVAELHYATYADIIRYDSTNLEETITEELVKPLKHWNFKQAENIGVKFKIDTEAADNREKMEAAQAAYEMGLKISASDIAQTAGLSMAEDQEEYLEQQGQSAEPPPGGLGGLSGGGNGNGGLPPGMTRMFPSEKEQGGEAPQEVQGDPTGPENFERSGKVTKYQQQTLWDEEKHPRGEGGQFTTGGDTGRLGSEVGARAIFKGKKFRTISPKARLNLDQAKDLLQERGYEIGPPETDVKLGTTFFAVQKEGQPPRRVTAKEIAAFLSTENEDLTGATPREKVSAGAPADVDEKMAHVSKRVAQHASFATLKKLVDKNCGSPLGREEISYLGSSCFRGSKAQWKRIDMLQKEIAADLGLPIRNDGLKGIAVDWHAYDSGSEFYASQEQPSESIDPAKARKILADDEVHGKPLTDAQRGMFGAAAGKHGQTSDPERYGGLPVVAFNQLVDFHHRRTSAGDWSILENLGYVAEHYGRLCITDAGRSFVAKYAGKTVELKEAAAITETPTDAQKESGNYRKGHVTIHGLPVTIETPKGEIRSGDGWEVEMQSHYGYIKRTEGADGDHVDVFLSDSPESSDVVFVVDQVTGGGRFDEHKVMIGYATAEKAKKAYLANYSDGWKCGPVTAMTIDQFKTWLKSGDQTVRVEGQVSRFAKTFDEAQHPRDNSGQFSETEGEGGKSDKPTSSATRSAMASATLVSEGETNRWLIDGRGLPSHLAKLRIPPAWTNVTVATDPESDLLVSGFDAKGRRQAVYSDSFSSRQAAAKFARVRELASKTRQIADENQQNGGDAANVMSLIMATGLRPGSTRDTKAEKKAYGATTLGPQHVIVSDGGVRLQFTGKKGVALDIPVRDETVAGMLLKRKAMAEAAGSDRLFSVSDNDLRAYVKTLDGGGFKPKDFRTLRGTTIAAEQVSQVGACCKDAKTYKKTVREVAKVVAQHLGNTPSIALQSYIDPHVFAGWSPAA